MQPQGRESILGTQRRLRQRTVALNVRNAITDEWTHTPLLVSVCEIIQRKGI